MCECNSIQCNLVELTYYQRNRDVILSRAKNYYENDKERLIREGRDEYRNLSEEEKKSTERIWKKQISQYSWRKKAKTKFISKKYRKAKKSQHNNK